MNKPPSQDLDALIRIFENSTWREMHLIGEGIDLFLSKDPNARRPAQAATAVPSGTATAALPSGGPVAQPIAPAVIAPSTSSLPALSVPAHWVTVRAPCLGTFYSSPKPGAAAFVSLGQQVTENTELCLVEVMKLFTSVRAGVNGTVQRILVEDATLVEFDQPLFYIEPHD